MTQTASEETLSSIGNTPLVKLDSLSGSAGDFYAKLEGHNPFGSVKDRAAYWMIKDGEERGKLVSGKSIIIEPTSGNTGIALTGIANILGYKVEIVIPEKASQETKDIIKNLGAKVFETSDDLCPKVGAGTDQSIALAKDELGFDRLITANFRDTSLYNVCQMDKELERFTASHKFLEYCIARRDKGNETIFAHV